MTRREADDSRSDEVSREFLSRRIQSLEAELEQARNQLDAFDRTARESQAKTESSQPQATEYVGSADIDDHGTVTHSSSLDDKLNLFMMRFAGRSDVYAHRWTSAKTGKSGWSPATRSGFYDAKRVRPEDYMPLTRQAVVRHLSGARGAAPSDTRKPLHIGLYPLRRDDTCCVLACDFDNEDWQTAAPAYVDECAVAGIDSLTEISSSGTGAHVWIFFDSAVPAAMARRAGLTLLRRAMAKHLSINFESYDRLFPSQDKLPVNSPGRGSFGNLIALPLQGDRRANGATIFADPHTWKPFDDQFQALDRTSPFPSAKLESLAADDATDLLGPPNTDGTKNATGSVANWTPKPRRADLKSLQSEIKGAKITMRRDSQVHIPILGMPSMLVSDLKHLASLHNPEFYRKQAMRVSTFGEPRVVVRFEDNGQELQIPRGLFEEARVRLELAGYTVRVRSSRRKRDAIEAKFEGELRPDQQSAVTEIAKFDTGVLVAPPGTGKTVIACALIADRKVATAILVPTRELLTQWRDRLSQFLSIRDDQIGQLGGGKRKTTGQVDLIMMRSISHRNADPSLLERYGQIIVDECHGVAAPAAEAAITQVDAPKWLGLTATPYRADQLNGLITMQCGPIRYDMSSKSAPGLRSTGRDGSGLSTTATPPQRSLNIHRTAFTTDEPGAGGPSMPDLYGQLATDSERNSLIIAEIVRATEKGRHVLALTNRIDHLRILADGIADSVQADLPVLELHGHLKPADRIRQRAKLAKAAADSGKSFVLVAIDKVAGEGFDLPALDTLFLTMPISFKGRVVQNLGRVTRGESQADEVIVHDFHDVQVAVLDRMFAKRQRAIKKEGFLVAQ